MSYQLNKIVGNNVKRYRKQIGISQEILAEKCGLHRTYIGGVERGERNITIKTLQIIAKALKKEIIEMFIEE